MYQTEQIVLILLILSLGYRLRSVLVKLSIRILTCCMHVKIGSLAPINLQNNLHTGYIVDVYLQNHPGATINYAKLLTAF